VRNSNRKAFTLAELLISVLILALVTGMGYMLVNRSLVSMRRQQQSMDTLHEARSFLMQIERDLRQMTKIVALDTVFKPYLFDEQNALFYKMTIEIPSDDGASTQRVTYTYEGPDSYDPTEGAVKRIYRETQSGGKKMLITKQLDYLKVWGTDGEIIRNKLESESMENYVSYLTPHYYHPTNPASDGLRDISKIRGIELQLSMHEMLDKDNKPIKQRTFTTRVYSRMLNPKNES